MTKCELRQTTHVTSPFNWLTLGEFEWKESEQPKDTANKTAKEEEYCNNEKYCDCGDPRLTRGLVVALDFGPETRPDSAAYRKRRGLVNAWPVLSTSARTKP